MFEGVSSSRGEQRRPEGVAIDSNNMVYVSEYGHQCVSVFTSEGELVKSFGGEPGQFYGPFGIAVDNSGVVYVCDCDNNRVQIF